MTPQLIGISGAFGAGKDEVAKILVDRYGYERHAFADALKNEVAKCLYHDQQIPEDLPDEIADLMYGFKGHPCKVWEKPTDSGMRRVLQFWGTEYRRSQDGDYWVKAMDSVACPPLMVVSDVRFRNEVDWVRRSGGQCWKVVRPDGFYQYEPSAIKGHLSEHDLDGFQFDHVLLNSGTLDDLAVEVRCAIEIYRCASESLLGWADWHSELREARASR
jgi:hypothetical protein